MSNSDGFILSDVFSRYFEIAELDPVSLLNLDSASLNKIDGFTEIALKISKVFPGCEGTKTLLELRKFLLKNLKDEALELLPFSKIFLDYHRIHCFFTIYNDKEEDVSCHIGYFNQLKCMSFCKDFKDIRKFVLKDSSIEEYFDEIEDSKVADSKVVDSKVIEMMYSKVMRNFYLKNQNYSFLEDEMKIFLSSTSSSFKNEEHGFLNEKCESILNPNEIHQKLMKTHRAAFDIFGDISAVYSYLKIRELQIREILYISDKILNFNR